MHKHKASSKQPSVTCRHIRARRHSCRAMVQHFTPDVHLHAGEHAVHAKLGVQHVEDAMHSFVRPAMPQQHQAFFASLPFVVVAARDTSGHPWASLLVRRGAGSLIDVRDSRTLRVTAHALAGDPLEAALQKGADVGLLGIELHSRRRNRANGHITRVDRDTSRVTFELAIEQSFGNCPQYISERCWRRAEQTTPPSPARISADLTPAQQRMIARADTCFLASGYRGDGTAGSYGMDASHRGGAAGFVRVDSATRLSLPVRCWARLRSSVEPRWYGGCCAHLTRCRLCWCLIRLERSHSAKCCSSHETLYSMVWQWITFV